MGFLTDPALASACTAPHHSHQTVSWSGKVCVIKDILEQAQGKAVDHKLTQPWALKTTGVTTDKFTPLNAVIMSGTVLLYLVIQVGICLGHCLGCSADRAVSHTIEITSRLVRGETTRNTQKRSFEQLHPACSPTAMFFVFSRVLQAWVFANQPFHSRQGSAILSQRTASGAHVWNVAASRVLWPQIPSSFFPALQPLASLLGGIACILCLAGYCAYQVPPPLT